MFKYLPTCVCLILAHGVYLASSAYEDNVTSKSYRTKRQASADQNQRLGVQTGGCAQPPPIENGEYQVSSRSCRSSRSDCNIPAGDLVPNNWYIDVSCNSGYTTNTSMSSFLCWKDHWTPPLMISCIVEKLCPSLKSNKIKCTLQGKDLPCDLQTPPSTRARCRRHYRPILGPEHSYITCLDSGHWSNPLFECAAACGESKGVVQIRPLVVDGSEAHVGFFPWHAGIYYPRHLVNDCNGGNETSWVQVCGGSLITNRFVLTAAHCVAARDEKNVRVGIGKYYRSWDHDESTAEKRNVSEILVPREFSNNTFVFDVALLLMDYEVTFGEFIMPACHGLMGGSNYVQDKPSYVVGWGQTKQVQCGSASEKLLYNDVMMVPLERCLRKTPSVYPLFEKFCTSKKELDVSVAQPGDSGGGLTALYDGLHYIFGIVSMRHDNYTMFTNLTWMYHMIWVENKIRNYDTNFSWTEIEESVNDRFSQPYLTSHASGKDCVVPEASTIRKFCSVTDGCNVCDRKCYLPSGSKAGGLRVMCAPHYSTVAPEGRISFCLSDGSWSPPIPECFKTCRPLVSDSLLISCNLGSKHVNCSRRMLPGTTATFLCSPSYLDFLSSGSLEAQDNTITCESSGKWSKESLPTCEPKCGMSKEFSTIYSRYMKDSEAHHGAFPWHAAIYHYNKDPNNHNNCTWCLSCGGTLITDRVVVTVSYCANKTSDVRDIRVALGKYLPSWDIQETMEERRHVLEVSSEYLNNHNMYYGISLMLLSEKIESNDYIMPVCCHHTEMWDDIQNKYLYVSGFGSTRDSNDNTVDRLLYNNLVVLPKKECNNLKLMSYIPDNVTCCIKNTTETDLKQRGDGGGGVTIVMDDGLHYLYGISAATVQHIEFLTNITDTTSMIWIKNQINNFNKKYRCGASLQVSTYTPFPNKGAEAHIGYFPWYAGLYRRDHESGNESWYHHCGGTLISDQVVLTAAVCVADDTDPNNLRIALGKYQKSWSEEEPTQEKTTVSSISIPPEYQRETLKYNFALVLLQDKVRLSEFIMPVCFPFTGDSEFIKEDILFAPGFSSGRNQIDDQLAYKALRYLPNNECPYGIQRKIVVTDKLCTTEVITGTSIIGKGDGSGGLSAVYKDGRHYLVGIAVGRVEDATLFTNVTQETHVEWIEKEIRRFNMTLNQKI